MLKKLLAATLGLIAANASAYGNKMVDVSVVDRGYGVLPMYWSNGQSYVAGQPGQPYSVRLANLTGERVLAVLSVDGVNAITGQTASPEQSGYVLEPFQSTEITGWRKNMRSVAQFVFTDKFDSYAAQTGRPRNVGVIGVAVYREQMPFWRYERREQIGGGYDPRPQPYDDRYGRNDGFSGRNKSAEAPATQSAPTEGSMDQASPDASRSAKSYGGGYSGGDYAGNEAQRDTQQLGTGHGYRERSAANYTSFKRRSANPDQVLEVFYDDHQALVDRGIIPRHYRRYVDRQPQSFPNGFVPDPYR